MHLIKISNKIVEIHFLQIFKLKINKEIFKLILKKLLNFKDFWMMDLSRIYKLDRETKNGENYLKL